MLLSIPPSFTWGAIVLGKEKSKSRRAAEIVLRMLVVVALTGLLLAWAEYYFETKGPSMSAFARAGCIVWFLPEIPSFVLDGVTSHFFGINLGSDRSYEICFCLCYGVILFPLIV
jgi:hypothetical protein